MVSIYYLKHPITNIQIFCSRWVDHYAIFDDLSLVHQIFPIKTTTGLLICSPSMEITIRFNEYDQKLALVYYSKHTHIGIEGTLSYLISNRQRYFPTREYTREQLFDLLEEEA